MTDDRVALIEAFKKADDGNFLRSLAESAPMAYGIMRGLVQRLRHADRKFGSLALPASLPVPDAEVAQGFNSGVMPSFEGRLTDEQVQALVDYLLGQ